MNASAFVRRTAALAASLGLVVCTPLDAAAKQPPRSPVKVFARTMAAIIVLENGRKKPMDTFARGKLLQFSGRQAYRGLEAIQWLAQVIFEPASAYEYKVFLINNPDVADALGIPPERRRRYSYAQILSGMNELQRHAYAASKTAEANRSPFDREILAVYENVNEFQSIAEMYSFLDARLEFAVDDTALARRLGLVQAAGRLSYLDLLACSEKLRLLFAEIAAKHSHAVTPQDITLMNLVRSMRMASRGNGNSPMHILPAQTGGQEEWLSLWGVLSRQSSRALRDRAFQAAIRLRNAYCQGDQSGFDAAARAFTAAVQARAGSSIQMPRPGLELAYNRLQPFFFAKMLYGIAALFSLVSAVAAARWAYRLSLALLAPGIVLHTVGIALRMAIMSRPPVTNLFETFVFVAWAIALLGLSIEAIQRRAIGLAAASIGGFAALYLSGKYGGDGDTMGMLAAVLNNNFWLATHIMTISLGYAGCCCAGITGHLYLLRRIWSRPGAEKLVAIDKAVYGMIAFGITFTVIGTMFGGMWADQSWGRFWGWDPKENGALLIILWCAILLHARSGGMIGATGMAAGSILGLLAVLYAWIGVNLLGIGMHSYGFTSAGARTLGAITLFETLFLAVTLPLSLRRTAADMPGAPYAKRGFGHTAEASPENRSAAPQGGGRRIIRF